jgi:hypothetical protein
VVQTSVFVPVEAMPAELPRDLQNPVVVSPVVRLFSLSTPAVNSADVDDETMAAIGQGVRTGRSSALNSGASPNLRLERLSPSRTGFTLKKKLIVKQTVKL